MLLCRKCTLNKQDTKNSSVDNVCCIFEDNYIFVDYFNTPFGHTSLFIETVTTKFMGPGGRHIGPKAEKNKYPF